MGTSELYTENVNCGGLNHLASTCSRESSRAGTIFYGSSSSSNPTATTPTTLSSAVTTSDSSPMELSSALSSSCCSTTSCSSSSSSTCLASLQYDTTKAVSTSPPPREAGANGSPSRASASVSQLDPVDCECDCDSSRNNSMESPRTTASFPEENCENYAHNAFFYASSNCGTAPSSSSSTASSTSTCGGHGHDSSTPTTTSENDRPVIKLPSAQELMHHQEPIKQPQPTSHNHTNANTNAMGDRFPGLGHFLKPLETPVTRFLNKTMFGANHPHTPPPAPSSPGSFGGSPLGSPSTNSHRSFTEASPDGAIHLPSLHLDANGSSRPIPIPNRVPLRDSSNSNASPRCALPHLDQAVVGSLPSLSSKSLASLSPTCHREPSNGCNDQPNTTGRPNMPFPSFPITAGELSHPLRYLRSVSCPSDAQNRPLPARVDEPIAHLLQPEYLRRATSSILDIPKCPVERTSSMDPYAETRGVTSYHAQNQMRLQQHQPQQPQQHPQGVDLHHWLSNDRHPLNCLAESAQAMLSVERSNPESQMQMQTLQRRNSSSPIMAVDAMSSSTSVAVPRTSSTSSTEPKREKKLCGFPGCKSNAVTRGLCISHGGGRRCQRKGCTRGAQSKGLCVAHGGGRICRARGCTNIQRSMGLCIRHGGGKRCSVPGCDKGVVRQDLCTAHGGKRKCKVENCTKHVKKKGLCRSHANSVLAA